MVLDNESLKSLVVTACFLLWFNICLKFIEGNAFGLPTTIKQVISSRVNHNFFQKLSNLAVSTCFGVTRSTLIRELDHL